jgi:acyl-CoA thioesterase FadM
VRWLRLGFALLRARFRSPLAIMQESEIRFRVWLTDIDASVMNHAAMLTVMEMGRIDLMVRLGFFSLARRQGWFFPSRSLTVQFLRPLKMFQKARLTTRILHAEQSQIHIEQQVERQGKVVAICLVESTVKQGRETVPAERIATILGIEELPTGSRELIDSLEHHTQLLRQHFGGGDAS